MIFSRLLQECIDALCALPGVGPKTAQRMALSLLNYDRTAGIKIGELLIQTMQQIRQCKHCRIFCETEVCQLCLDPKRQANILCITETPADVIAIEQTGMFRGLYFVLQGHLSPIDGITPNDIGMDQLETRLQQGKVQEIILATNPTLEGEATAHYIAELAKHHHIKTSRIAYGVPIGGELEYLDSRTLAKALERREVFE